MQVAREQIRYCTIGWKEKHHRRKLQWVKGPHVQVEYYCQCLREKHQLHHCRLLPVTTASTRCKGQGARCKSQDSTHASWSMMQQQHATPTTTNRLQNQIHTTLKPPCSFIAFSPSGPSPSHDHLKLLQTLSQQHTHQTYFPVISAFHSTDLLMTWVQ